MTTPTTPRPTTSSHLVPTSPHPAGTTSEIDLVPRPHPERDEVELASTDEHTKTASSSPAPGRGHTTHGVPMTYTLLTPRCRPAWVAAHQLLADGDWHPKTDIAAAMHHAADLSERTIQNHLARAGARGWIQRSRGHIRLRQPDLLAAALEARSTP